MNDTCRLPLARIRGRPAGRLLVVLLVWFAGGLASPALTIATYNLENYLVADRMVEGVYRPAYPKPEKEKAALRQVVRGLAPDVLAVEEMGPQAFLDEFQRELRETGQDFPYTVVLDAADPDRHVAVLSKVPFKEIRRHARVPFTYFGKQEAVKRGVLEVVFAAAEGDLSLFVVHLKSRHTERPDDPESAVQRRLEAEAVRELVLARFPDPAQGRFVLCGDWNDTRASPAVTALAQRGETSLGTVLPAADAHGETWTHFYRKEGSYSRIDYVLVSPALLPLVRGGQAAIYDGPGVGTASDHRPVLVQLQLTPGN